MFFNKNVRLVDKSEITTVLSYSDDYNRKLVILKDLGINKYYLGIHKISYKNPLGEIIISKESLEKLINSSVGIDGYIECECLSELFFWRYFEDGIELYMYRNYSEKVKNCLNSIYFTTEQWNEIKNKLKEYLNKEI